MFLLHVSRSTSSSSYKDILVGQSVSRICVCEFCTEYSLIHHGVASYMFLPPTVASFKEHLPEVGHSGRQKV